MPTMNNWEKYFGTPEKAARMNVELHKGDGAEVRLHGDNRADGTAPILREFEVEDYEKWLNEEADNG